MGIITNPSATSVAQTTPWIYQYTAELGYFRAMVRAIDCSLHKPWLSERIN